jgi:hypothetical protein
MVFETKNLAVVYVSGSIPKNSQKKTLAALPVPPHKQPFLP